MEPWYKSNPELLAAELQELRDLGAEVSDCPDAVPDQVRWRVILPLSGIALPEDHALPNPLRLVVTFPDHYPYFRPEVEMLGDHILPRHHHPFGRTLCLLGRATFHWDSDETVAGLLRKQVPMLAAKASIVDLDQVRRDDAEQAEPFTDYYSYSGQAIALLPGEAYETRGADARTLFGRIGTDVNGGIRILIDGAALTGGDVHFDVPEGLRKQFSQPVRIPVVSLPDPILAADGAAAYAVLRAEHAAALSRRPALEYRHGTLRLAALTFPEESIKGTLGRAWVLLAEWKRKTRTGSGGTSRYEHHYVRCDRVGSDSLFARVPELAEIPTKVVCIVGLGALGAPLALELARCGIGELRLLDHDRVESGPTVRWPLGLPMVGILKVHAIERFVEAHYPFTRVHAYPHRIGAPRAADLPESELLAAFLAGADIVVDASAEWGVTHLLGDLAKARDLDFVRLFATKGAWGGEVVHVRAGEQACWGCVYAAQQAEDLPLPAEAPDAIGEVQPAGCADPTFTGTSYELAEVVHAAVRMIVSALTTTGGASVDWDVGIVSLRNEEGRPIPPRWYTAPLLRHEGCGAHKRTARDHLD